VRIVTIALLALLAACRNEPADTEPADSDPSDTDLEDTDPDTDPGDTDDTDPPEPEPAWSWCPGDDVFVGPDEGAGSFLSDAAVYCAESDENVTLEAELARKVQLRFAEGSFRLPTTEGTVPYRLPACTRFAGERHADVGAEGTIRTEAWSDGSGGTTYVWTIQQILEDAEGDPWTLQVQATQSAAAGADPAPVPLDGSTGDPFGTPRVWAMLWPGEPGSIPPGELRTFGSCEMDGWPTQHHTVTFDGGAATFDLRIGEAAASTEPAVYLRAQGTLDGVAFDVTDWWRLPYNPTHHHGSRDFGVIFDAPIGGACGLVARELDRADDPPLGTVATVGCDLAEIAPRTVTAETWTSE
jgi:hypothetical protein